MSLLTEELVEYSENTLNRNYIVEKSNPLTLVYNIPFTLGEFKILDTYLSRINARDDSRRTVRFSIEDYEKLMGVQRVRIDRIEQMLDNMLDKKARFSDANSKEGFVKIALFERSACYKDDNGKWWVELTCTDSAKEYIFSLEKMGYAKYYLSEIISLKTMYSYCLFTYLIKNNFRSTWTENLDNLKRELNCTSESYNEYKYFKRSVLDKAIKEVAEKTNKFYKVTAIKSGKNVVAIRFQRMSSGVELLQKPSVLDGKIQEQYETSSDMWEEADKKYENEDIAFLAPACNNEFSDIEMDIIYDLLRLVVPRPKYYQTDQWDYLRRKYHELNLREQELQKKGDKINNRFAYYKTMIEADLPPKK